MPTARLKPAKKSAAVVAHFEKMGPVVNVSIPKRSHSRLLMAMLKRGEKIRGRGEGGIGRKLGQLADDFSDGVLGRSSDVSKLS